MKTRFHADVGVNFTQKIVSSAGEKREEQQQNAFLFTIKRIYNIPISSWA